MKPQALQYTIRCIPPEVDQALRDRAKADKKSINEVIVDALTQATIGRKKYRDFSDVCGKMEPDPAFDEMLEWQRQIHPDDWK
jgi:hypothetical protein